MTTFAQLAKGGVKGKGMTLSIPGDPDASFLVELCRPDGEPRMPYKQDAAAEGEARDPRALGPGGGQVRRDRRRPRTGPPRLRKATPVVDPRHLSGHRPHHGALAFSARRARRSSPRRASTRSPPGRRPTNPGLAASGGWPSESTRSPTSPDGKWQHGHRQRRPRPSSARSSFLDAPSPTAAASSPATSLETTDTRLRRSPSAPTGPSSPPPGPIGPSGVWDVATGKELALIEEHADWIFDLAWIPDGNLLDTASRYKTSKVFDVEKKESIATFPGHAETVYCRRLFTRRRQVRRHRRGRQPDPSLEPRRGRQASPGSSESFRAAVFRLLFTPDGKTLLACGADKTVRVFENFAPKQTLTGHNDWVYSASRALTRRQDPIASGSWGRRKSASGPSRTASRSGRSSPLAGYKPEANAQAARNDEDLLRNPADRFIFRGRCLPAMTLSTVRPHRFGLLALA